MTTLKPSPHTGPCDRDRIVSFELVALAEGPGRRIIEGLTLCDACKSIVAERMAEERRRVWAQRGEAR